MDAFDKYLATLSKWQQYLKETGDVLVHVQDCEEHSDLNYRQVRYAIELGELEVLPLIMNFRGLPAGNYVKLSTLKNYRPNPRGRPRSKTAE